MDRRKILIVDPSEIIRQGIGCLFRNYSYQYDVTYSGEFNSVHAFSKKESPHILILNPSLAVDNSGERIRLLRQDAIQFNFRMVALVYAYFDEYILSLFDDVIYINDDAAKILAKIKKLSDSFREQALHEESATLSQRELDVIRFIALGYSNREIGEELHISIHTVISHRKNITTKLGIKSASGLTIYAVINKLISSEDFEKTI
jgi:DNA-binding NarL/FixJ family response regulator